MGETSEPLTTGMGSVREMSHKRILLLMTGISAAVMIAGFAAAGPKFGAGVIIGAMLAFVNYFWQRNTTRAIIELAVSGGEKPALPAARYIIRYLMLGAVLWFFYATSAVSVAAVILGLATFAFAIVLEGLIGIFSRPERHES